MTPVAQPSPLDTQTPLSEQTTRLTKLLAWLETSEELDRLAAILKPVATRLNGAPALRDVATGRFLGHPAHPALVSLPLGCWTATELLDLFAGSEARRASQLLVGAGVLTAGPAVVSGLSDWVDTEGAEKRIGIAHALCNFVSLGLFTGSWLARRSRRYTIGLVLGSVGASTVAVAGFLGGHLAYVRGVGVNTTAFESGPTEWTPIKHSELSSTGQQVAGSVNDVALVILADSRTANSYRVLEDRCTHRGGPLHEGKVEDGCLVCPWHGSKFDVVTGTVQRGPASVSQPVYEVRHVNGEVEVKRPEHGDLRKNPVTPGSVSELVEQSGAADRSAGAVASRDS